MIIIIGRWLLPKGKISRSALSQLLLVYLSLASDMFDLLSIFITILMQDLPFFILRLIAVIHFEVQSYTTIFFTCKNLVILSLLVYRLLSICTEHMDPDDSNDLDDLSTLPRQQPTTETLNIQ